MTVQVLVVTMNQKKGDYSLLDKMNIQSDAIVCNQCDYNEVVEFIYKEHKVKWMSFKEKGVGLNRNNGLMRSTADICILADDDMVFLDGYQKIVLDWFEKYPQTDILLFHLLKNNLNDKCSTKVKKVWKHNFGRYGAARVVFRSEKVKLHGIFFNTMFGGGCPYSCGEDTLFLSQCLNKGLKMLEVPCSIACLTDGRESTWFEGYTDKFFYDKGVLYYVINRHISKLLSLYHCLRHRKKYAAYGWYQAWKQMCKGINSKLYL